MTDNKPQSGRTFQPDTDVHITLEDQQKINQFARCNAKHEYIRAELKTKQNELKNIEDAVEELLLQDEAGTIPFRQGEVFICLDSNQANEALEKAKKKIGIDISELEEASKELKDVMTNLKIELYAKFGDRINLEEEES